jgi:hypothetical protein
MDTNNNYYVRGALEVLPKNLKLVVGADLKTDGLSLRAMADL